MSYVGPVKNPSGLTMQQQRAPNYGEKKMPLDKSGSKESIGKNIETESKTKPHDQAVAIALNTARDAGAKIAKPSESSHRHKEHR